MTGHAGIDRRGVWVDDTITGTKFRIGEVSTNLAMTLTEHGNRRAAEEAMRRPHFGFWLSKEF